MPIHSKNHPSRPLRCGRYSGPGLASIPGFAHALNIFTALSLAAIVSMLAPAPLSAQRPSSSQLRPPSPLLRPQAVLELNGPVEAVAINADESIIAAAVAGDGGERRVVLFDRPSKGRLGMISARVGERPRLRFSPTADLLLIGGSEALQLWSLPIASMKPGQPLARKHRRWGVGFSKTSGPGSADFGTPPDQVYWVRQGGLFRRGVDPAEAAPPGPAWAPETGRIRNIAFDRSSPRAVVVFEGRKALALLNTRTFQPLLRLQGHRFDVIAAGFGRSRPLLSLDQGNNLVTWGADGKPGGTVFLGKAFKSVKPSAFQPTALQPLGSDYLLLTGPASPDGGALLLPFRGNGLPAPIKANGPEAVAASPTGRYVAVGEGASVRLFVFARPTPPMDYVRHLRGLKAYQTAQSYVRLMDDRLISPQLKGDLLDAVGQQPRGKELRTALTRLREAEQGGDADRIRRWAKQVLRMQSDHPDAVAALRRLREKRERQVLERAREAFNQGQNRIAITLLSGGIGEDSGHYPAAMELIRQAEARRSVRTVLKQAREKLTMGYPAAARALVKDALRGAPEHPAALALLDEIDEREGGARNVLIAVLLAILGGMAAIGYLMVHYRRRLSPFFAKLRLDDQPPLRAAPWRSGAARAAGSHGVAPEPPPGGGVAPGRPAREKAARAERTRPAGAAARKQVIATQLKAIEEQIAQIRQADVNQQHTALLMGLEAELQSIGRQINDPGSDLGAIHARVKTIGTHLQSLGASLSRLSPADSREPTYYDLLNLPPDASLADIKGAYHELVKQYHPDKHNNSQFDWIKTESERMSRKISEAYEVLSDDGRRARYDRKLRQEQGQGS